MRWSPLLALLLLRVAPVYADDSPLAVEARLLAPCCWNQTLEVHASPLADELRAEIRTRLSAGESGAAIEDDLARRYGERIRALPRGEDPLRSLGPGLALALLLIGGVLIVMGRRWREAAEATPTREPIPGSDGADARLDAELARLED